MLVKGGNNMQKDYFKINESEEKESNSTSYSVFLSFKEIEELERCKKVFEPYIKKQKKALSSIIKLIILNTYLYLNNIERFFNDDVNKTLNKNYFKNSLDHNFVKKLKEGNKEYEFILELVRNQIIRINSNRVIEEGKIVQFRLAKDDDKLLRIFAGNKCFSFDEFFSGYLIYFLSLPMETKNYIITYPNGIKLERAIKEKTCIIMNNIKYKPVSLSYKKGILKRKVLICFDAIFDSFVEIDFALSKNIDYTEELFMLNDYERNVLDLYNKLEFIDISFKVLNNDNKHINRLIDDNDPSFFIIERKHEYPLEKIRIRYFEGIIKNLKRAYKKNIDYLCFSDNYNEFIKLTEEKQKELIKYQKQLKLSD